MPRGGHASEVEGRQPGSLCLCLFVCQLWRGAALEDFIPAGLLHFGFVTSLPDPWVVQTDPLKVPFLFSWEEAEDEGAPFPPALLHCWHFSSPFWGLPCSAGPEGHSWVPARAASALRCLSIPCGTHTAACTGPLGLRVACWPGDGGLFLINCSLPR